MENNKSRTLQYIRDWIEKSPAGATKHELETFNFQTLTQRELNALLNGFGLAYRKGCEDSRQNKIDAEFRRDQSEARNTERPANVVRLFA